MTRFGIATVCLAGLLSVLASPAYALLAADDKFDSDTVGSFPSAWQHLSVGAGQELYVTNSISATPSLPNVFAIHYLTNTTDDIRRNFTAVPLTLDSARPLVINYDLRVDAVTANFSAGFQQSMGNTALGDAIQPMRMLSTVAGTWAFYDTGIRTNSLATGVWYNVRIDTWLTNATTGAALQDWYIDGELFYSLPFTVYSLGRTNINYLRFIPQGIAATGMEARFFLDNLSISVIPEPSTVLLIGVGGWVLWRARRRGRR
ncbi:PEP-CTERM sorting domain-containing protein [bacterium]|nr:PEP-CTERM sorting domain-containing protein [bacterium]